MKERIRKCLLDCGAVAVGFAKAQPVEPGISDDFSLWISEGHNAGMAYMANHFSLRQDPRGLLDGAATVISLAFPYAPREFRPEGSETLACYAYGLDYHDVLRKRLSEAMAAFKASFGGDYRICIDSAPVMERYWAVKAGIGYRSANGNIIVPGHGSMVFLAEIITTLDPEPDSPLQGDCGGCGLCHRACPAGALLPDGTVDSRRCLSYLTIEHRGEWTPEQLDTVRNARNRYGTFLFGCDICVRVCPHNRNVEPTKIQEFFPIPGIMTLSSEDIRNMDEREFPQRFRGSAVKRAKFAGLRRNSSDNTPPIE